MPNQLPQDASQLDRGVLKVMSAIKKIESGGDYNAVGDLDKGVSKGAYQFNRNNFQNWAKEYGLNPDDFSPANQNKVAYTRIKKFKDEGRSPEEIAALWNGAKKDSNGRYTYINPQYGERFRAAIAEVQNKPSSNVPTGYPTPPEVKPFQSEAETTGKTEGLKPEKNIAQKGLEFLFPILEQKERTALQTVGDIGMSVLPFIPGLGQAGLLAKGARAAGVASKAAKGAKAAEETGKVAGIVSRLAGSPVAQATVAGYGTGASKNLSEGKNVGESFGPNLNTLGGATLGAGAGLLTKAAGGIINKASGIPENIKPRLANLSNPKLYDEYATVGARRAQDVKNPSLIDRGVQRATKAVDKIQAKLKESQKEIGQVIRLEKVTKVKDVDPVIADFSKKLSERFGVTLSINKRGVVSLKKDPTRMKNVLEASDEKRIKNAVSDLLKLRKTGNLQRASDVLDNLDEAISYGKRVKFGGNDPLNGFLKETRHALNEVIGKNSPRLAKAKARARGLHDVIDEIASAGGTNFQRADLLLKRALSGDKDALPREVFELIKKETGVDLMDDAVLINHFSRSLGDPTQTSLLAQYLENAAQGASPTLTGIGLDLSRKGLMGTVANPVSIGRNIVQGKKGLVPAFLQSGLTEAAAIEATRALPR